MGDKLVSVTVANLIACSLSCVWVFLQCSGLCFFFLNHSGTHLDLFMQ